MKALYSKKNGVTQKLSGVNLPVDADKINYDNTDSELQSTNLQDAIDEVVDTLDDKVDKVTGKGLSANDYADTDKAKVGKIDETTTSASGNPISISGLKSNQLAKDPVITLEPIQAGSGDPSPSNVRAISGYDKIEVLSLRKNLLHCNLLETTTKNGVKYTPNNDGTITIQIVDNTQTYSTVIIAQNININISYPLIFTCLPTGINPDLSDTNATAVLTNSTGHQNIGVDTGSGVNIEANSDIQYLTIYVAGDHFNIGDSFIIKPMIRLASITDPTYEPYNPLTDIQLTLGQTIYGGTLDVEKGILTVTRKYLDCKSLEFTTGASTGGLNWSEVSDCKGPYGNDTISNKLIPKASTDGWNSTTPCYSVASGGILRIYGSTALFTTGDYADSVVVGTLKEPFTIQLTPHEISLLKDYAYVSTNGTNMSFSYKNGEIASLADVESLGKTMNLLGDVKIKSAGSYTIYQYFNNLLIVCLYTFTGNKLPIKLLTDDIWGVTQLYDTISHDNVHANIWQNGNIAFNSSQDVTLQSYNIYGTFVVPGVIAE